jgi:hypothetical protein
VDVRALEVDEVGIVRGPRDQMVGRDRDAEQEHSCGEQKREATHERSPGARWRSGEDRERRGIEDALVERV